MILYLYIDVHCEQRAVSVITAAAPTRQRLTSAHTNSGNLPAQVPQKPGDTLDAARLQVTGLTIRGPQSAGVNSRSPSAPRPRPSPP